jgi:uncharacterized protein (DUF1501 family)
VLSAFGTSRELTRKRDAASAKAATYPQSKFGHQLGVISQFIKAEASTRVYYTAQFGYDTHYAQLPQHTNVLGELSRAVTVFMDDLRESGLSDRALLMAFSGFGRRAQENGSLRTDHSAAGPVFLAGDKLKSGLVGETPSLSDLQDDDLKTSIDFRRIYTTLPNNWLELPLGQAAGTFTPLPLIGA